MGSGETAVGGDGGSRTSTRSPSRVRRLFLTGEGPRPTSALYLWIPPDKPALGRRGVRTERYTLMIEKTADRPVRRVLHDNLKDPYQLEDIADEHPEIVKQLMQDELMPWLKKTNDPWL